MSEKAKSPLRGARLFTVFSFVIILALSTLASFTTRSIIINQPEKEQVLCDLLSDPLCTLAVSRARSLDPGYQWLKTEQGAGEEIIAYMQENILASIRASSEELSTDSNLAWIITNGKTEYRHNWKAAYNTEKGSLNFTIRYDSGKASYSGSIQPGAAFSRDRTILVNPSLVPADRMASGGTEYTYQLVLPDGFSIHYFIPTQIQGNGGPIARIAASLSSTGMYFSLGAGLLILLLFVLLTRWKYEQSFRPVRWFSKTKALFAWTVILIGLCLLYALGDQLRLDFASGQMDAMYQSIGFGTKMAGAVSLVSMTLYWAAGFFLLELGLLYIKYIMAKGFFAYLKEDSLTVWILDHYREKIAGAFGKSDARNPAVRLMMISVILTGAMMITMIAGGILFHTYGLILAGIFSWIFLAALFWGVYQVQARSYQRLSAAADKLAHGDFDHLQNADAGMYQPLYDQLMHISDSYQEALKEGLSSQVVKTQLISNVSHDLKTPIAGILTYSELISQSDNMEDIKSYTGRLENYAGRLSDLVEDLLNVARATSGDIQLNVQTIDLVELILQVESDWEETLEQHDLSLVFNMIPAAVISLDPSLMVRIIENLLSNICKYSLAGSRVFISLEEENGLYLLTFKNTSRDQMDFAPEHIVERFVRGDSSRHESGSGLGLAIVKSFVEVMSGTFEVQIDGDLFKALITFPVPPVPQVPSLPEEAEKDSSDKEESANETPAPVSDSLAADQDIDGQNGLKSDPA